MIKRCAYNNFSTLFAFFVIVTILPQIALAYSPTPYSPIRPTLTSVEGDLQFSFVEHRNNDYFEAPRYLKIENTNVYDNEIKIYLLRFEKVSLHTDSDFIEICYYVDKVGDYSARCGKNIKIDEPNSIEPSFGRIYIRPSGGFKNASDALWFKWKIQNYEIEFLPDKIELVPALKPYEQILLARGKQNFDPFQVFGEIGGKKFTINGVQTVDFTPESIKKYEDAVQVNYQSFRRGQELGPYIVFGMLGAILLIILIAVVLLYRRWKKKKNRIS